MADKSIPTIQQLAGNVGIGTTNPDQYGFGGRLLTVNGGTSYTNLILAGDANSGIAFGSSTGRLGQITMDSSTGFQLYSQGTGNSLTMVLNRSGNVGIGTTSPGYKLDVNGEIGLPGTIRLTNGGGTVTYISEAYGINLNGDSTHPIQINATLLVGYNASGGSYGTNNAYIAGNVGIGTTSPLGNLDVNTTANTSINITAGSTGLSRLIFGTTSGNNRGFIDYDNTSSVRAMIFRTNESEAMRITSGGILGFNGSSAPGNASLDKMSIGYLNSSYGWIQTWNGTPLVLNKEGNNVGIGTTSPSATLTVSKAASNYMFDLENASEVAFKLRTYNSGSNNGSSTPAFIYGLHYNTQENAAIRFYRGGGTTGGFLTFTTSDGTEKMRLDASGNLGIGTTSPDAKLRVEGTGYFSSYITAISATGNNGSPYAGNFYSGDDSSAIWRAALGLQHNANTTIVAGSSVGLVFSPLASTNSNFYGHAALKAVRPNATANNQDTDLAFWTRSGASNSTVDSEKMRITSGGNVGIGTTSPDAKLTIGEDSSSSNVGYIRLRGHDIYEGNIYKTSAYGIYLDTDSNAKPIRIDGSAFITGITGNVGIGTTAPSYLLHVNGASYFNGSMGINGEGNGITVDTGYGNNGRVGLMKYGGLEGMLVAGNTTVLRLGHRTDSDNVATSGAATIRVDMLINAAGNVGIGTTSPGSLLHTYTTTAADNAGHIQYENANTGTGAATNAQLIGKSKYGTAQLMVWENYGIRFGMRSTANSGAGDIYFTTGTDSVQMVIKGGNVGIGTTSPYSRLTIGGALSTGTSQISILNTEGGHYIIRTGIAGLQNQGLSIISADADGSNQNTRIAIASSGNVGIGTTSPTYKLDVSGSINIAASNYYRIGGNAVAFVSGNEVQYGNQGGSQFVTISTGTTEKLRIQTDGNVGIGTTSPSSVLDVVGNIEYSGITKGSRGENKNFSSYDWCWHGRKYSGYVSDVRTKLYEYFYTTTALTDESYPNTYDLNSNSYLSFGGDSYTAIYTTHLHSKRGITFNATLNGDDPYALWINGEYVAGADGCCTGTAYSYTFNPGWYRIDMIYSESGGGDYVQLGWNPKDYTDYIDAMAPFGPLDFYNSQLSMRGGNVGIGTLVPAYKLDVSGTIRATGDVIAYSDARVKDNVTTVENALDKVKSLRGVTYTRKDDDTKSLKVGVIAQEVLPILPEVVQQDNNGNYSVAYGNMVGVLIEAIKEQQRQIDDLKYLLQTINK